MIEPIGVAYFAARYSRNAEMRKYRDQLKRRGVEVSARWIDQHGGDLLESFVAEKLNSDPEECAKYALIDLQDISNADTMISFTSEDGGGKGGRHVEFGRGLEMMQMILIGPREHVFHTLPEVKQFNTWEAFLTEFDASYPEGSNF
jgi:hypothetical protein